MIVEYLIIYQKYSVGWEFQNLYITLALATSAILLSEFIRLQENEGETRYVATQLGLACLASSLSPDEGMHVAAELQRAGKAFVLENELHLVYQVRRRGLIQILGFCSTFTNCRSSPSTPLSRGRTWTGSST